MLRAIPEPRHSRIHDFYPSVLHLVVFRHFCLSPPLPPYVIFHKRYSFKYKFYDAELRSCDGRVRVYFWVTLSFAPVACPMFLCYTYFQLFGDTSPPVIEDYFYYPVLFGGFLSKLEEFRPPFVCEWGGGCWLIATLRFTPPPKSK